MDLKPATTTEALDPPPLSGNHETIRFMQENNSVLMSQIKEILSDSRASTNSQIGEILGKVDILARNMSRLENENQELKVLTSQLSTEFTEVVRFVAVKTNSLVEEKPQDFITPDGSVSGFPETIGAGLTRDLKGAGHFSPEVSDKFVSELADRNKVLRRQTDYIRQSQDVPQSALRPPDNTSTTVYSVALEKFTMMLEARDAITPPSVRQAKDFVDAHVKYKVDNPGAQEVFLTQKMGPMLQSLICETSRKGSELSSSEFKALSNDEVLDCVRKLVVPKSRGQFISLMKELVQFPDLKGKVESVVDQSVVSSTITTFMNRADEMYNYLRLNNTDNVPNLCKKGKEIGLLDGWFYPALMEFGIPFEKHFADKKDDHAHNNFITFREKVKVLNIQHREDALKVSRLQKSNAAFATRRCGACVRTPPATGKESAFSTQAQSLDEMHAMFSSLSSLSSIQDEPPNKGCFVEIFFGVTCTKKGCSFDHAKQNTSRWRVFYANQLDWLMNPQGRKKAAPTIAQRSPSTAAPSLHNLDLLHPPPNTMPGANIPTRDSLTDEGKEMFDRLRAQQAQLQMDRNAVLDGFLFRTLTNQQAAALAHHRNNAVDINHDVKQKPIYYSAPDSDDDYDLTYTDPEGRDEM